MCRILYLAVWTDVRSKDLEESLEERLVIVVLLGRQAEHRGRQLGRVTHHHQLTVREESVKRTGSRDECFLDGGLRFHQ
jgi:hypothetical protein